jgi:HSP20 family molecular chaperone IbpA
MTAENSGRLSRLGESIGDALLRRAGRVTARVQKRRELSADVLESEDAYRVVFDVPGATRSDVQVKFVDGGVSLRVDRFREFHEGFDMRFPGRGLSLDGRVELPDDAVVDAERAMATLTDRGTLEVELPKRAGAPDRTEYEDDGDEMPDVDARVETVDRTDEDEISGDDSESEVEAEDEGDGDDKGNGAIEGGDDGTGAT